ncbi:hypothetical protein RHGRI_007616 [Rhododendron griersonianum]|uniref:Uncharacterized protein n=1 Tax=Rhododendron griersonianum TaxID=479676 RepID=A0AAV6KYU8_9ERIC|nr:hypothetical protein RHGRI_007616 [Rhododendron griersonianum]
MEMEVDKEDVAMDVVVSEPKSQQEVFSSEEELVEWTRFIGKRHGFVIIIKASEKFIKNRKLMMRFSCERSRKYRKFVKKS